MEFLGGVLGTSQPRANTGVSGRLAEVCKGPLIPLAAAASRFCRWRVRRRAPLTPMSAIVFKKIVMETKVGTFVRTK